MEVDRFIVAEVSKNWIRGQPISGSPVLCQSFELIINANYARGYRLHSFALHRLTAGDDEMNETIIAVFEKE
jgi:hypothetical protein